MVVGDSAAAQSPQADAHDVRGKLDRDAGLGPRAALEPCGGIPGPMHAQPGLGIQLEHLCRGPGFRQRQRGRGSFSGRAHWGRRAGLGYQEHIEPGQFQNLANSAGGVSDAEAPLDGAKLAGVDHQDPDAGRADVIHLRHVHQDRVLAGPDAFGQRARHVVAPGGVHPALEPQFELSGAGGAGDFHRDDAGQCCGESLTGVAWRSSASGMARRISCARFRLTSTRVFVGGENGIEAGLSPRMIRAAIRAVSRPAS